MQEYKKLVIKMKSKYHHNSSFSFVHKKLMLYYIVKTRYFSSISQTRSDGK